MDIIPAEDMGTEKETENIDRLLLESGLRPSPARILVTKVLQKSNKPLSVQEIEQILETLDRSSITRTLPRLLEAGLIHGFSDGSGSMKYEFCRSSHHQPAAPHNDLHAHFRCHKCGETICLTDVKIKMPRIPQGYKAENVSFIITGLCPGCDVGPGRG